VRRVLIVGACLCLAGACLAQPQGGGQGGRGGRGGQGGPGGGFMRGGGELMSLMEDVRLLNALVSLQLTDAQLTDVLAAYDKIPAEPDDERVAKLRELRQRLVQGTPLADADWQALRDMFQRGRGQQGQQQGPPAQATTLSPLGQAIWALLTDRQRAILLASAQGGPRGGGANAQGADRNQTMDLLTKLNTAIRATDEAAWPAKRDALADALAAGAGEAGSQARKDKAAMFAEFLDSLRKMPEADFEQKKAALEGCMVHAYCHPQNFKRLDRVCELAAEKGVTVPQLALAYVLNYPLNLFALVGACTPDEVRANLPALDIPLTPAEMAWLNLERDSR